MLSRSNFILNEEFCTRFYEDFIRRLAIVRTLKQQLSKYNFKIFPLLRQTCKRSILIHERFVGRDFRHL